MNKINELIKQGAPEFFERKSIIFHVEYPSICNQHCSYCLEGNFSDDRIINQPWETDKILKAIDKIFDAYDDSYALGFIIAGGEPTIQPSFLKLIEKLKSRKNTYQVVTTNFTQSEEFYRTLDIPLVTSLHLDFHEPQKWLEKTIALKDLILETRIMAHPQKMDKVKEAYNLFMQAKDKYKLSFSVEKIDAFTIKGKDDKLISYNPEYNIADKKWVQSHLTERQPYSEILSEKAGVLKSMFYSAVWYYKNGDKKTLQTEERNFKNWFCERNIVVIKSDGTLFFGWYCDTNTGYNIFKDDFFPKDKLKTVVCQNSVCPLSFGASSPKYKDISHAPKYTSKVKLLILKLDSKTKNLQRLYKLLKLIG